MKASSWRPASPPDPPVLLQETGTNHPARSGDGPLHCKHSASKNKDKNVPVIGCEHMPDHAHSTASHDLISAQKHRTAPDRTFSIVKCVHNNSSVQESWKWSGAEREERRKLLLFSFPLLISIIDQCLGSYGFQKKMDSQPGCLLVASTIISRSRLALSSAFLWPSPAFLTSDVCVSVCKALGHRDSGYHLTQAPGQHPVPEPDLHSCKQAIYVRDNHPPRALRGRHNSAV
ncbi:hypothetical protein EYF80_052798 [Liparis tanakae]|uniref:Uncharacterized protein n=1 Tax=Liparis tanakae TaxID=230148 RepID=A0A4Z2F768_9TELE|nr:hypothetical protein EYF80_052798 [Liparis tanakae]